MLQRVRRDIKKLRCDRLQFERWMRAHEGGRYSLFFPLPVLCDMYHIAHVQRSFLRVALCLADSVPLKDARRLKYDVVCAGSFPANHFCGQPQFADDIDVFVRGRAMARRITILYSKMVAVPLRGALIMKKFKVCPARINPPSCDISAASVQQVWKRDLFSVLSEMPIGMFHDSSARIAADALTNLPSQFKSKPYTVLEMQKLVLHSSLDRNHLGTIRPLNIIIVDQGASGNTLCFRDLIFDGFDMKHCCVSLSVRDNLLFDYHCAEEAKSLLSKRKLVLTPSSFRDCFQRLAVKAQCERIYKYAMQGFKW